ncbi:trypsin domain-containing protein [Ditylenchus destructor]|nr:trypsin domain-containing protein [Ditylenchus destructor]
MFLLSIFCVFFCLFTIGFSDLNCGISSSGIPPHSHERVVNGYNISDGDHPWLVNIWSLENGKFFAGCGGTIIGRRWILTAGHCKVRGRHRILFGSVDFNDKDAVKRSINVKRNIDHPEYVPGNGGLDIALVELSEPLPEFNDKVQPICLLKHYKEVRHSLAVVVGWGRFTDPTIPGEERHPTIAQEMEIPIDTVEECIKAKPWISPTPPDEKYDICAGGLNRGTEVGDSGGPLMLNKDGRWWQIGAVSRGQYLGTDWHNVTDLGVYSRVAKACPWIEETTNGEVKCYDFQI